MQEGRKAADRHKPVLTVKTRAAGLPGEGSWGAGSPLLRPATLNFQDQLGMATNVLGRQQREAEFCMIEVSLLCAQPGATLRPHLKTKQKKTKQPLKQQTNKQGQKNKTKQKITNTVPRS